MLVGDRQQCSFHGDHAHIVDRSNTCDVLVTKLLAFIVPGPGDPVTSSIQFEHILIGELTPKMNIKTIGVTIDHRHGSSDLGSLERIELCVCADRLSITIQNSLC